MAQENKFLKELQEKGLVDERGLAVVGDIVSSNGNSGRAFILISGDTMHLYAMEGFGKLGFHVESINLKEVELIKARGGIFLQILRFAYHGHTYTVRNFGLAAQLIEAIKKSIGA